MAAGWGSLEMGWVLGMDSLLDIAEEFLGDFFFGIVLVGQLLMGYTWKGAGMLGKDEGLFGGYVAPLQPFFFFREAGVEKKQRYQ